MKNIQSSNDLLVFADKTANLYEMNKDQYNKLLHDNVTKSYQKSDPNIKNQIDIGSKKIAESLNLEKKMESYANRPAFITLKDHKDNFKTKLPCRLINPAKSEIGIVAKKYLEPINAAIVRATASNQWRNTATVINWFKEIPNKNNARFIKFDIAEFYPSISEDLLKKAIEYAGNITTITEDVMNIIKHARKSLLLNSQDTWIKKGENPMFDVIMGSYDGAEICELVGLFLLSKLSNIINKTQIGLYRDYGLAIIENPNGPKLDKLRKYIIALFKIEGLNITIETNLTNTDFLDVTFDLTTGKYYPFRKPNDNPIYINECSNHPPSIIKQLPKMVNKRISALSCDEQEFDKAKTVYEAALKSSGHRENMKFEINGQSNQNTTRRRKIIWFNPPYNMQVKMNIDKVFLKLIKKHFPKQHKFNKIFNSNTIKISYSCTTNMENVIKQHNSKVLHDGNQNEIRPCNCRDKSECPMDGKCLSKSIVYKAEVESNNNKRIYYGISEGEFKNRYYNH